MYRSVTGVKKREIKLNWVQLSFHFKESKHLPFLMLFKACFD
jgi:hypothetical protein